MRAELSATLSCVGMAHTLAEPATASATRAAEHTRTSGLYGSETDGLSSAVVVESDIECGNEFATSAEAAFRTSTPVIADQVNYRQVNSNPPHLQPGTHNQSPVLRITQTKPSKRLSPKLTMGHNDGKPSLRRPIKSGQSTDGPCQATWVHPRPTPFPAQGSAAPGRNPMAPNQASGLARSPDSVACRPKQSVSIVIRS